MKYIKILGLLAVAAAALMAFAGTASATLTDRLGNKPTSIHASNSGNVVLTGPVTITCGASTVGGNISKNEPDHVEGSITTLTFTNCGTTTVTVIKNGKLTATDEDSNTADVFSSGTEVTVLTHSFFLGTRHCTYLTNNTTIGTLTGTGHLENSNTGAKFDISATIPVEPETSDDICGEGAAVWEGSYVVSSPDHLKID